MESNLKNLKGADVAKGIEISEHGAIGLTGAGIDFPALTGRNHDGSAHARHQRESGIPATSSRGNHRTGPGRTGKG